MDDLGGALGAHHCNLSGGPSIVEIAAQMFGRHNVISAAVSLAGDDGHLGHRRLAISKQQLCAMLDHAAQFLRHAGQKAGHIDQSQDRNFKGIAKADKPRRLARTVDVKAASQNHRLIGNHADRLAFDADKACDDIGGKIALNFKEIGLIGDLVDQLFHIIGLVWIVGDQRIKTGLKPLRIVKERAHRSLFAVVQRQKVNQAAGFGQGFDIVFKGAIGDRGFAGMGRGTAQLFGGDHLVCHGFHHIGAGDEHVRAVFDHEDKVGHRGRIDRPPCARPHDQADLRHHARGQHIALKHLGIACKRGNALLDARAAGIVHPDHRRAILHRHIHDFADLLRMGFGKRAAKDGEILAKHIDHAAVHRAPAGDHAVACGALGLHAEIGAAVGHEHVEFFKRAFVEQKINPLARGQLALGVLRVNPALAAAHASGLATRFKLLQNVGHGCVPP